MEEIGLAKEGYPASAGLIHRARLSMKVKRSVMGGVWRLAVLFTDQYRSGLPPVPYDTVARICLL